MIRLVPRPFPMSGITVAIQNATAFCLMLPPQPGQNVGNTEGSSLARCTVPMAEATGSLLLPKGFIRSAHFISTNHYVQVTGQLDRGAYGLAASDQGGEYDSDPHGSRPGSVCAGATSYFSYVEPSDNRYCIRCCQSGGDCDSSQDLVGCLSRMTGNYGPGFTQNGQSISASESTSTITGSETPPVITQPSPPNANAALASSLSLFLSFNTLLIVL